MRSLLRLSITPPVCDALELRVNRGLFCRIYTVKKGAYSSSWNSPQNYWTPLVKWDHTVLSATGQVGTRFIDPVRMKGWVSLVGWLHTEMVYPSTAVTHPSTNRIWRSATTLIEANALPLSQTANGEPLKTRHSIFVHHFEKRWPILKILSLLDSAVNSQRGLCHFPPRL